MTNWWHQGECAEKRRFDIGQPFRKKQLVGLIPQSKIGIILLCGW
jgi:hypothetical protein